MFLFLIYYLKLAKCPGKLDVCKLYIRNKTCNRERVLCCYGKIINDGVMSKESTLIGESSHLILIQSVRSGTSYRFVYLQSLLLSVKRNMCCN